MDRFRWNEWDLRKEALLLSNARKATSKSVQTDARSGGNKTLVEMGARVADHDQKVVNTSVQTSRRERATHTGTTQSFIIGLAGESDFPIEHITVDELSCNV